MRYRTITDLPTELLHTIFSQVQNLTSDSWYQWRAPLYSSSLTCKRLRDVSLEFVFKDTLRVRDITTFEHLIRFLDTNPRALKRIQSLTLSGTRKYYSGRILLETTVDDALVARVVDRLPNLQIVKLESFLYLPSPSEHHRNHARRPCELRSLSIRGEWNFQCSVAGLLQVLSLFSAQEMDVNTRWWHLSDSPDDSVPFDVGSLQLHRSLAPALLHVDAHVHQGPQWSPSLLAALTQSLRPDTLRDLRITIDSPTAACALGELLLRAGGSITALTLHRRAHTQGERDGWVDPLRGTSFSILLRH